jgi:hypothetical protein
MWGATIILPRSLKTTWNEKFFKKGQILLFFKSYMTLKYLLIINFPKFDLLTAAGMALCVNLGVKMSKFIPLSLRLSGIAFSLV